MAKVAPFHSTALNAPKVHHNNSSCTEGNNIEAKNKASGTGNHPLCAHCGRLS